MTTKVKVVGGKVLWSVAGKRGRWSARHPLSAEIDALEQKYRGEVHRLVALPSLRRGVTSVDHEAIVSIYKALRDSTPKRKLIQKVQERLDGSGKRLWHSRRTICRVLRAAGLWPQT